MKLFTVSGNLLPSSEVDLSCGVCKSCNLFQLLIFLPPAFLVFVYLFNSRHREHQQRIR